MPWSDTAPPIDPIVKDKNLTVIAADHLIINRVLVGARLHFDGKRKRCTGVVLGHHAQHSGTHVCRLALGFFAVDMVEHCGRPKTDGDYVHP